MNFSVDIYSSFDVRPLRYPKSDSICFYKKKSNLEPRTAKRSEIGLRYGSHLIFLKFGLRFSKKAFRPSFASSVMYAKRVASPANNC